MRIVRGVKLEDADAIWRILEPMVRAGETYPLPREMNKDEALAYWMGTGHEVFVAEEDGKIVGTYFLKANQKGGGAHVANCGYVTAAAARGRGLARMMCHHSIERAKERAFRAMQFNFVVATNANAVRLWQSCGLSGGGAVAGCIFASKAGIRGCLGDVSRAERSSVAIEPSFSILSTILRLNRRSRTERFETQRRLGDAIVAATLPTMLNAIGLSR
jgi:GNAT superfamily N-acetyltransferase